MRRTLFSFLFFWLPVFCVFAEEPESTEDQWKLNAGGQIRLRGDLTENQNLTDFAFTPGEKESQLLERTRLYGSIENRVLGLKGFVQPQWYGRWGGTDESSEIDLYQGYVEWEKILGSPMSVKAGRQEFSYGSNFFLGPNDFYNGLSWDGFKINVHPWEDVSADIIGTKMAKLNSSDPSIYLAGVYSTYKIFEEGVLEGYFFYNKGGFPSLHREFELDNAGQKWFTLGARFAGKVGGFDYELEPQFQWGSVKNAIDNRKERVRAYGGHLDLGYTFELPWEPRIFASYALGSGDDDPFDGKFTEFHGNLFNDSALVGDMSVIPDLSGVTVNEIHASGIQVWVAGISINPLSNLNLNLDVHRFYSSKGVLGFSKDLGEEVDFVVSYKPMERLSFLLGLSKFFTGRFFEEASGSKRNIDYFYLQGQFEF